ncbi:hypothetical protein ACWC98_11650 [Streptomyces goshikiensis]
MVARRRCGPLSPGKGGKLGLEFTFDPKKFTDAAGDAADVVGDAAGEFKDWLLD